MGILSGLKKVASHLGGALVGAVTGIVTGPVGIISRTRPDPDGNVPLEVRFIHGFCSGLLIYSAIGSIYGFFSGLINGFESGVKGLANNLDHAGDEAVTKAESGSEYASDMSRTIATRNRAVRENKNSDPFTNVRPAVRVVAASSPTSSTLAQSPRVSAVPYSDVSTMKQQGVFRAKGLPSDKSSINAPTRRFSQGNAS